eukprot:snap_masked-scaffold_41-processed-gene-1.3-mRNA-1 protein AED:1.00 eAED:1.00 QI:0/0/0/0/1/1/2/0/74
MNICWHFGRQVELLRVLNLLCYVACYVPWDSKSAQTGYVANIFTCYATPELIGLGKRAHDRKEPLSSNDIMWSE